MAEEKISAFLSFKGEIESDLDDLHGHIEAVRAKFRSNAYSDGNKSGVLTHAVEHYLGCIEVNHS